MVHCGQCHCWAVMGGCRMVRPSVGSVTAGQVMGGCRMVQPSVGSVTVGQVMRYKALL